MIEKSSDRTQFYLKGFLLRKQGRHFEAISSFESALSSGDKSVAVYRDYAESLYRCGRFSDALNAINVALERDAENVFVLDLVARICINGAFIEKAREALMKLERYDLDKRFALHRRATFNAAIGAWESALVDAEAACATGHSPFEAFATKIDSLIHLRKFDDADQAIREVEARFGPHRRDVQLGLKCKVLLWREKWREAKVVWDQLHDKTRSVHRGLLIKIIELQAKDATVSLAQRQQAEREREAMMLTSSLSRGPDESLILPDFGEVEDLRV